MSRKWCFWPGFISSHMQGTEEKTRTGLYVDSLCNWVPIMILYMESIILRSFNGLVAVSFSKSCHDSCIHFTRPTYEEEQLLPHFLGRLLSACWKDWHRKSLSTCFPLSALFSSQDCVLERDEFSSLSWMLTDFSLMVSGYNLFLFHWILFPCCWNSWPLCLSSHDLGDFC